MSQTPTRTSAASRGSGPGRGQPSWPAALLVAAALVPLRSRRPAQDRHRGLYARQAGREVLLAQQNVRGGLVGSRLLR